MLINYFKESFEELKKLHYPGKKETYITTITIVITIAVFSLLILFSDFLISKLIVLIFGI